METEYVRVRREALEIFCQRVFQGLDLSEQDASLAASVLVAADARGIPSHGVARLQRYVNGLEMGLIIPNATVEVLVETPSSIVIHAHGAMGAPVSAKTMRRIIGKARASGAAFGCVRDSNHFGIAGYYAMMALDHDMIGIAMTNTAASPGGKSRCTSAWERNCLWDGRLTGRGGQRSSPKRCSTTCSTAWVAASCPSGERAKSSVDIKDTGWP